MSHRKTKREVSRQHLNLLSSCPESPINSKSSGSRPFQHRSAQDAGPQPFWIMPDILYTDCPQNQINLDPRIIPKGPGLTSNRRHIVESTPAVSPAAYMTCYPRPSVLHDVSLQQEFHEQHQTSTQLCNLLEAEPFHCACEYQSPTSRRAEPGWVTDHPVLTSRNSNSLLETNNYKVLLFKETSF